MIRLYVFCEGFTEQAFVKLVLQPHLFPAWDIHVEPILIAHSRRRGVVHRGGVGSYAVMRHDMARTLKQHSSGDVRFSTMIDLYKLPGDFPGKAGHSPIPGNPTPYVETLERRFATDIDDRRFVPYLQLYEYETLLFSNPEAFRVAFDSCDRAIQEFQRIIASVPSIEHINDGENTAPSKRIIMQLPRYSGEKVTAGTSIAAAIGIDVLRQQCPHFDTWVGRLESLRDGGI